MLVMGILSQCTSGILKTELGKCEFFPLAPIRTNENKNIFWNDTFSFLFLLPLQLSRKQYSLGHTVWVSSEPGHEISPCFGKGEHRLGRSWKPLTKLPCGGICGKEWGYCVGGI